MHVCIFCLVWKSSLKYLCMFSLCSICRSWPAAASSQRWTIRSTTTTCASSTITYRTSEHELNETRHHQRAAFSEDSGDKAQSGHTSVFLNKRVQPLFKVYVSSLGVCRVALDTDVSLCTIPPTCGLDACWFYVRCLRFKLFLLYFVDVWRQGAMCCSARSRWVDWR